MFIELGDVLFNLAEIAYVMPYHKNSKYTIVGLKNKDLSINIEISYQEALKTIKAALEPPVEAVDFGGLKDVKSE